jgi:phosphoglycolate phosphatase
LEIVLLLAVGPGTSRDDERIGMLAYNDSISNRLRSWSHIRGVLFDKDGTLLDYAKTWAPINRRVALAAARGDVELAAELMRAGGFDPDTGAITPGSVMAAGTNDEIAACFATILGARTPAGLPEQVSDIFAQGGGETAVLIDGVWEAVLALRGRGIKVGVATNDTIGGMRASLQRVGMLGDFDFLVAADSGHGAKPGPGMGLAFAQAMGLAPGALAMVGDATHDLDMAKAAGFGMKVAVLSGTGTAKDLARHADVVLPSVRELVALLT